MRYRKTPTHPRYSATKTSHYGKVLWSNLDAHDEVIFTVRWYNHAGEKELTEQCYGDWIEPIWSEPSNKKGGAKCTSIW